MKRDPLILCIPRDPLVLGGVPAALRAVHQLAQRGLVGPLFVCSASRRFGWRWTAVLDRLRVRLVPRCRLTGAESSASEALLLANDGAPVASALAAFVSGARERSSPSVWMRRGRPIALYKPAERPFVDAWSEGAEHLDTTLLPPDTTFVHAAEDAWIPARDPDEIRAAEKRLARGLGHAHDGFLSRFDRGISTALSLLLVRTPITPNLVTWASIAVGIAGAALTAAPGRSASVLGLVLVWFSAILDGCDGEVARLKLACSASGARLDLFGDHVVNLSVIAAVVIHVERTQPWAPAAAAGLGLAVGVVISAVTVWFFLHGRVPPPRGAALVVERLASRDFVYLLLPLAAIGRLDLFLYAAAVGSNLFWIALLASRWLPASLREARASASRAGVRASEI